MSLSNIGHPARLVVVPAIAAAALIFTTCRPTAPPEIKEPAAVVVENPALRLRLNGVPDQLHVVANDDTGLVLEPADPAVDGRIVITTLDPEVGQNLPAEVDAHQSFIASQAGGDPRGGQELVSPLGTTFYSRGRYLVDDVEIEETEIVAIHPDADRIVTMTYRYPAAGDSTVRVQQLFDVLAVTGGID